MKKIAILGGGISGLSAAYFAKKAGFSVTLFEKETKTGGLVHSLNTNAGVIDLGPSSIRDTDGTVLSLVEELGLKDKVVSMDESGKTRFLVRDKQIHALKPNPFSFIASPVLSGLGKLRILGEPFSKNERSDPHESLYNFFARRIGKEAVVQLLDPIMSGIYAGDIRKMSASVVVPKLVEWERDYGSLLMGALKSRKKNSNQKISDEKEKTISQVLNFEGGLETLTSALRDFLTNDIITTEVRAVKSSLSETLLQTSEKTYSFEKVISTIPSYSLAEILEADPSLISALKSVVYVPMFVMAIRTEQNLNEELGGFGFLIPRNEGIRLLGSIHRSSIFPELCTSEGSIFTMFAGGRKDERILENDLDDLKSQLITEFKVLTRYEGEVEVLTYKVWPKAIPQMEESLATAREMIEEFEKNNSLSIGGNFRWGVSLPDCIRGARNIFDN